jgi:hypothetical protein
LTQVPDKVLRALEVRHDKSGDACRLPLPHDQSEVEQLLLRPFVMEITVFKKLNQKGGNQFLRNELLKQQSSRQQHDH